MHTLHHLVHLYGYPVITVAIALECAGLIIPAETLFVGTVMYASTTGRLSLTLVIVAACAGAIVGAIGGFALGRLLGARLIARHGARMGLTERRLTLARYLFAQHGGKVVFFGRFVSVLRSATPLLAGASLMRWPPFLAWCVAGGIVWPVLHGVVAAGFGRALLRLSGPVSLAFGALAAATVLAVLYGIKRNETRLTAAALAWEAGGDASAGNQEGHP